MTPRTIEFLLGTLRGRLIVGVAAVHAVMMALFVADLTTRQRDLLLDRQSEEATALAQALATTGAHWIVADDLSGLQELVEAQRRYPELQYALLTDVRGWVKAATDRSRRGLHVLDLPGEARLVTLSRTPGLVDVAAPAIVNGVHVGWARVGVGQGAARGKLAAITRNGIGYALAAIAAGTLIAWVMGRRFTHRLYAIQETINAVRGGDPRARTRLRGTDEAAAIGREFDAMIDAVAERDARLSASEASFRGLIQGIQVAVVVHGPDTRILSCNPMAQRLLGLSEAQLLGRSALDPEWRFTRGDGVSPLPQEEYPANQVVRSRQPVRDQVYGVRRPASGDEVTVLVNADPVLDEGGAVAKVIVTFVDITARRNAERALAERTLAAELSAEVGHVLAREGALPDMLQGCADALVRRLGVACALVWTGGAPAALALRACAAADPSVAELPPRLRDGEGAIRRIAAEQAPLLTGVPLAEEAGWAARERLVAFAGFPLVVEGALVGVLAAYSRAAITGVRAKALAAIANEVAVGIERKLAEEALHRSEERYRRIVETAHEGIWVVDGEGATTFVNQRMASMLGYAAEEMLGAPVSRFTDEEGRRALAQNMERRRRGIAEQHEFRFRRKDGSELWTVIETTPFFDAEGAFAGALGMITDLTDRRRMEDQVRQSQKLEAVGRLAGGVAHDFNNVLTAILGDAEDLAERLAPGDPLREDVVEIQAAAQRAAQLTRQLLAFGRKQAAEPRVIDLREVVSAMERLLGRLLGENIELAVAFEPCPATVRADPGQIEQIVINLAVNARDAMPKGGRLGIELADVELAEDDPRRQIDVAPGSYVMISVTDTGLGMSREVQSHLFEPFFTTKKAHGASGLGLSTVYGIVKQCGGGVAVQSEPERGSTFRIYLPRALAATQLPGPTPASLLASRGNETILLAEDEAMVRAMAVRVLRKAGYRVIDAGDGEEALRLVADRETPPIDLLVADVVMPRLGGPDLAARLRQTRPDLEVLFVSGYTDRALDLQGDLGHHTTFLSKPFTGSTLTEKIREILDRARARSGALETAG